MKYYKIIWAFMGTLLMLGFSCTSSPRIIDKPILFNADREALTIEYLAEHYGIEQQTSEIIPRMIVLHWTAISTFEKSFEILNPVKLPGARADIQRAGVLNVSSQFMIDRDGTIYRLMPETTMARHVIGLNHCAIGVENVGGTEDTPMTKAQVDANIFLVNYLAEKYDIDYLIGHYEYTLFEDHELWLEQDPAYRTVKNDPGVEFMEKVREGTKDLNFKPVPNKNDL